MPFFISNPTRIEAYRVPPKWDHESIPRDLADLVVWLEMNKADWHYHGGGGINLKTLEGVMHASPGDWIIKGVKGEFYPCKPDVFAIRWSPSEST